MNRKRRQEEAVIDAIKREHKRFASDVHDGICQDLVGIAMMLDALRHRPRSNSAIELESIADHVRRVAVDARRLALGLAPAAVERAGLAGALALLKRDVEALGPVVSVSVAEEFARVSLDLAVNFYRIAQEATANAVRHSGASHVSIVAEAGQGHLLLMIRDDGCGIQVKNRKCLGVGIESMVSRAELLGGELELLPSNPHGTTVQIIVKTRSCLV